MILYHGSTISVGSPDIFHSRDKLDFGKGFYLTDRKEQAASWVERYKKAGMPGVVNYYEFPFEQVEEKFAVKKFEEYNREWLDFVIHNRQGKENDRQLDVITGGIANDKVFTTVELYEEGLISAEEALGRLRYHKPNWQICVRNQQILDGYLVFRGSEVI